MNYHQRVEQRKVKNREYSKARLIANAFKRNKIAMDYEDAYFALYGERILILFYNGWYNAQGMPRRHNEMLRATRSIWAQVHEKELQGGVNEVG